MAYGARSEFGTLKRVLMHRPGVEFGELTEATLADHHFASIPDLAACQRDHDLLTGAIRARGAEVLLLTDVLKDDAEAMAYIAHRPNLLFTRDLAVMVSDGAVLMSMMLRGRKGDPWIMKRAFERLGVPIVGAIDELGLLEGGGITFIDEKTCVIGLCDRVNPAGVKQFCDILFRGGYAEEIVLVLLPTGEVHIDGSLMMVGPEVGLVYSRILNVHPSQILRPGAEPRYTMFGDYLAQRKLTLIELGDAEREAAAINIIVTDPFQGVGYDTGQRLFDELKPYGGDYTPVPSAELIKGNGGPHCMTCPIERA